MILQILLLVAGFILLLKGADWFVAGASGVAEKFGVSQLVIGLTIVAMGTSAPEAAVSITAALRRSPEIAIGNVVGSNILNILIILGITALIIKIPIQASTVKWEMPYMFVITVILLIMGGFGRTLSRLDGIILLALMGVYMAYLFRMAKNGDVEPAPDEKQQKGWFLLLLVAVGIAMVLGGAEFTVRSAQALAKMAGMSEKFISLTVIAFGTSLPELITSVVAAKRGNADLAIGNIVGSNIFNILFILGLTSVICPIHYSGAFFIDTVVAIGAALLLWGLSINGRNLNRWNGALMLIAYAAYFVYLAIGR